MSRWILLLITGALLSACSEDSLLKSEDDECNTKEIRHQYIVHWRDRGVSLIKHDNIKAWMSENRVRVAFVEPDYEVPRPYNEPTGPVAAQSRAIESVNTQINSARVNRWGARGANLIVAVIDSGVDITQPYLKGHLLVNSGELPEPNGVDDDGNGFVDDINGWNFANQSGDVTDELGHGTAVAGIISGMAGNDTSLAIAPQSKILPVDFINGESGTEFHAKQAIDYALMRGANIVNNSWATPCSSLLRKSFEEWQDRNVIFVNAAGNMPIDVRVQQLIPPSLDWSNLINVGSTDPSGHVSRFSGYGSTVRLYAPGENIPVLSRMTEANRYATSAGTSLSAAIVSGAAAVVWSARPDLTAKDVVARLLRNTSAPQGVPVLNVERSLRAR